MQFLRIARGMIGITILWALAWTLPGLAFGLYRAQTLDIDVPVTAGLWFRVLLQQAVSWTIWGAASGLAFSIALTVAERHRSFADLSGRRFAAFGAVGALTPAVILLMIIIAEDGFASILLPSALILGVSAMLGAGCAAGTFLLARRSATT